MIATVWFDLTRLQTKLIQNLSPTHGPQVVDVGDEKNIASITDIWLTQQAIAEKILIAMYKLGRNKEK